MILNRYSDMISLAQVQAGPPAVVLDGAHTDGIVDRDPVDCMDGQGRHRVGPTEGEGVRRSEVLGDRLFCHHIALRVSPGTLIQISLK